VKVAIRHGDEEDFRRFMAFYKTAQFLISFGENQTKRLFSASVLNAKLEKVEADYETYEGDGRDVLEVETVLNAL